MRTCPTVLACLLVASCAGSPTSSVSRISTTASTGRVSATDAFFARLTELCGKAYAGKLGAHDASDLAAFEGTAIMHVRECSASEIRIPFHVGENRSRTWIITRTADGLRLKHDHRHEDGTPDELTLYGGDSSDAGSAGRQQFPADAESKAMFAGAGMNVSIENVWAIEVERGQRFVYELRRPNRHFSVEFDLGRPVALPPAPWGNGHVTPTAAAK
jgi:hypothetical protein